jgi:N-glycosylase/DNA lyase
MAVPVDAALEDYTGIIPRIQERLAVFDSLWEKGTDSDIFYELVFCILTPQSKPELCWEAVKRLKNADVFSLRSGKEILNHLYGVRFKYKKSGFVFEAKERFEKDTIGIKKRLSGFKTVFEARMWLVRNVKGIGIKEASHFLRNIGIGGELAILDRHVLRFLESAGVIKRIPSSLTGRQYLEIEKKMGRYAEGIGIRMSHLDFVLFYRATGKIFK